jgi:hypothetical protein
VITHARSLAALALAAALASAITGCGPEYDHTDISNVKEGMFGARIDRSRIEVKAGMIATAHIVSYNDDNEVMPMSVRAANPGILDVTGTITDHDFAFIGVKEGTTEVEILADNKVVLIISAEVRPQPAAP